MKKTFKKHYVKRDPSTLRLIEKDGEPVVGDFIRETRITQDVADEVNSNWRNSAVVWVEVEDKKVLSEATEKAQLWEKVEKLVEEGKVESKPHPASGVKKLKELIERFE